MKNFLEFGVKKFGEKKIYETLSGNLYDTYMLGRYFKDIYNLDKLIKNKIKFNKNLLHDTKDLKFNLINFFLLLKNKKNLFYEFGFTLFEKIFYFRFFNNFFSKKLVLKKVKFSGNEISSQFIFFCQNFYKDLNINVTKDINKTFFSNSVFFSKGVTLLYEKKNMIYLNNFIRETSSGSFDISLYPNKRTVSLETGYKLYYPSINDLNNLIRNSNKHFFYRNKKKIGKKIYIEILYGDKNLGKAINNQLYAFSKIKKIKAFAKYLSLNTKFRQLNTI
jgi:hypothetical protein|tara:strand:+ start:97 stop:927 length:831 start_codon:yes stop_codon:yes gene_type:complete